MIAGLAITALMAMGAMAAPTEKRDSYFNIHVVNKCARDLDLGIYSLSTNPPTQYGSTKVAGANGGTTSFVADFNVVKLRLSTLPGSQQYTTQSLFEFGYAAFNGLTGTAYDLSLMGKSAPGMMVVPANGQCETKICDTVKGYPVDQVNIPRLSSYLIPLLTPLMCWTDPSQANQGSPADTGCYHGPTDFTVTYCPAL